MNKAKKLFSMGVLLTIFTLFTCHVFAGQPASASALYRTTTTFIVKAETDIHVKVTFDQTGNVVLVERCFSKNECEEVKPKDQREVYSCVLLEDGEKPTGTVVKLKHYATGKDRPYDCEYVTATEPGELVMYKAGNNTSCPFFINGRKYDPCKGK